MTQHFPQRLSALKEEMRREIALKKELLDNSINDAVQNFDRRVTVLEQLTGAKFMAKQAYGDLRKVVRSIPVLGPILRFISQLAKMPKLLFDHAQLKEEVKNLLHANHLLHVDHKRLADQITVTRTRVEDLRNQLNSSHTQSHSGGSESVALATSSLDGVYSSFYAFLEEKFRGSQQQISNRLQVYRPYLEKLKQTKIDGKLLDIGCGRGEWLQMVQGYGIPCYGVDAAASMAAKATEVGVEVMVGDGLAHLKSLASESLSGVTAFHVVEHLTFDQQMLLLSEAFRVLKRGGILILETPNPENIVVGACNFYMDPSHTKPLPPLLLEFLAQYAGFVNTNCLRLSPPEQPELAETSIPKDILRGFYIGRDYAIIASKTL